MKLYEDCNLCSQIRAWYKKLSRSKKEALAISILGESELIDEIGTCENCGGTRYGMYQCSHDKWLCNICFWSHAFGKIFIE